MLLAGTLRAEANLAVANGLFLLLLFLGGMAYPLDRLPDALEAFASVPAGGRAVGEPPRRARAAARRSTPASSRCSSAWAVAAPLAAARWFRWEE